MNFSIIETITEYSIHPHTMVYLILDCTKPLPKVIKKCYLLTVTLLLDSETPQTHLLLLGIERARFLKLIIELI